MALLAWKEDYSVRVRQFDDQHRRLIEMVNKLHDAVALRKGPKIQSDVLSSFAAYTQTHFSDEERVMMQNRYPGFHAHKKAHDQLVARVRAVQRQIEAGDGAVSPGVMNFLKDWLLDHIQGVDMQYGPYLNAKGVA